MDKALRHYLATHRGAVNAAALDIARSLADPDDTDRDARRLVRDARAALHQAIAAALATGPVEGGRQGVAGEVCVVVRVPPDGQGSIGKIWVSAARLDSSALIPCPDDWPQVFPPPSGLVERLQQMIFPLQGGPRLVEADEEGNVPLGSSRAGIAYVMEGLPEGEVWLRPLDPVGSSDLERS